MPSPSPPAQRVLESPKQSPEYRRTSAPAGQFTALWRSRARRGSKGKRDICRKAAGCRTTAGGCRVKALFCKDILAELRGLQENGTSFQLTESYSKAANNEGANCSITGHEPVAGVLPVPRRKSADKGAPISAKPRRELN